MNRSIPPFHLLCLFLFFPHGIIFWLARCKAVKVETGISIFVGGVLLNSAFVWSLAIAESSPKIQPLILFLFALYLLFAVRLMRWIGRGVWNCRDEKIWRYLSWACLAAVVLAALVAMLAAIGTKYPLPPRQAAIGSGGIVAGKECCAGLAFHTGRSVDSAAV